MSCHWGQNLTYNILTNRNLAAPTDWGIWQTVTATNSVTTPSPISLGTNALFVQAELVWNSSPNSDVLPDWMSMFYFNALVPTNYGYITNGLVAYWRMNDIPGTNVAADSSGNSNTLTLYPSNNPPTFGPGYLTFNGSNQYGQALSDGFTNLDGHDMSICAWIKKTGISHKGIVNKYDASGTYEGWSFQVATNDELDWFVNPNDTDLTDTAPGTIPLGQWTFVTVVWQYPNTGSNNVSYYINGILHSSSGTGGTQQGSSGTTPLQVGTIFGSNNYDFDGFMHDVAIYNRPLSSNEVAVNYLSTEFVTTVPYPDLLYFKMTEYGETNIPLGLSNSATYGTNANGIVWNTNSGSSPQLPDWVNNPGGYPSAIHFHGLTTNGTTNIAQTQITATNSTLFNFTTNPFTINVWVGSYGNGYYFMGNDIISNSGWYLSEAPGSHGITFGGETNNGDYAIDATNGPGNWGHATNWLGEWYMITVTYDGTNAPLIYINAAVQETTGTFKSPAPSLNYLIFGLGTGNNGYSDLDGDMWLPQIWSTNLSPSDIANLFQQQKYGIPWP